MTIDEYNQAAFALRAKYPERPTEEEWDLFFQELAALGPGASGIGEAFHLDRERQRQEDALGVRF
jgi:hypothetical protein